MYKINDRYGYIIGIDLRTTHFYVFVSDLNGAVLFNQVVKLSSYDYGSYLNALERVINAVTEYLSLPNSRIVAVGMSIAGVTDFSNQVIERSNELEWLNKPLATDLEARVGIPVFVETEVRIYARNEIELEEPNNVTNVLYINRGIGLALVINNQVFQGFTNRGGDNRFFGSELDQLYYIIRTDKIITEINSQPYYSKSIKREQIEELNRKFDAHISHPDIRREIDTFTMHIANLMIALTHIMNPKKVLLTGNVFDYNDYIYNQVRDHMLRDKSIHYTPDIKRNMSGTGSLERGLVKFVMEKFFSLERFEV